MYRIMITGTYIATKEGESADGYLGVVYGTSHYSHKPHYTDDEDDDEEKG